MSTTCPLHELRIRRSARFMPPPNHYFDESPQSRSDERTIDVALPDVSFSMRTDRGVFSHGRLDTGTAILLARSAATTGTRERSSTSDAVPARSRSRSRCGPRWRRCSPSTSTRGRARCVSDNAARLGLTNVTVVHPDEVPGDIVVDLIWSNPPIRIGKPALHAILADVARPAGPRRVGRCWSCNAHLGADSLERWLRSNGHGDAPSGGPWPATACSSASPVESSGAIELASCTRGDRHDN